MLNHTLERGRSRTASEHEIAVQWMSRTEGARGTLAGRYEYRGRLGVGGMAQVFLAWDLRLQREVAIKMLRSEFVREPFEVSRFLIEGQLLARIESDHIVQVFDLYSDEISTYLVLERLSGETVESAVRRGVMSVQAVKKMAIDVLKALADLHRADVIHRDIKPSNILVGTDRTMLFDLGVASDQSSPGFTRPQVTVGTPVWMSPEQRMTGHVDARSDVYQLGLVMLHALTAQDFSSSRELGPAIAKVPAEIADIVGKAIAEDAIDRYQHADEMRAALEKLGAETVVNASLPGPAPVVVAATTPPKAPAVRASAPSGSMVMPKQAPRGMGVRVAAAVFAAAALVSGSFAAFGTDEAQASAAPIPVAPLAIDWHMPAKAVAHEVAPARVDEELKAAFAAAASEIPVVRPVPQVAAVTRIDDREARAATELALAMANAATGSPDAAPIAVKRDVAAAPTPTTKADAGEGSEILAMARTNENNGAPEVAIAAYRRYLREYPDAPGAKTARSRLTLLESGRIQR